MRVLVMYNPRAGRGRGEAAAVEVRAALSAAGHTVGLERIGPGVEAGPTGCTSLSFDGPPGRDGPINEADLVVLVGGDGTLHHVLDRLVPRRAAVYQYPLGTENLFAREFGMRADPAALVRAVAVWRVRDIDVGICDGRRFALIASIGADAGVIRRLTASRTGAIGHRHYLGPVVAELWRPMLPRLTVEVDGRSLVVGRLGLVVVANSRHYALRIDPARGADVADGLLEVVFLPASSSVGLLARLIGARFGWPGPGAMRARGGAVRVRADGLSLCAQLDGEAGPARAAGGLDLTFGVELSALRVLVAV